MIFHVVKNITAMQTASLAVIRGQFLLILMIGLLNQNDISSELERYFL